MIPLVDTLAGYVMADMLFPSPWCPCCGDPMEKTKPAGVAPYRLLDVTRRQTRQAIVLESSCPLVFEQETDLLLEVVDEILGTLPVVDVRRLDARPWHRVR